MPKELSIENREREMQAFRREIALLRREEQEREETAYFLDPEFDPGDLMWEDKVMWEKVKTGVVTGEDISSYRDTLSDSRRLKLKPGVTRSRYLFSVFVVNKALVVIPSGKPEQKKQ